MAMTYIMASRGGDPGGCGGDGVPPAVVGPWCGIALQRYFRHVRFVFRGRRPCVPHVRPDTGQNNNSTVSNIGRSSETS